MRGWGSWASCLAEGEGQGGGRRGQGEAQAVTGPGLGPCGRALRGEGRWKLSNRGAIAGHTEWAPCHQKLLLCPPPPSCCRDLLQKGKAEGTDAKPGPSQGGTERERQRQHSKAEGPPQNLSPPFIPSPGLRSPCRCSACGVGFTLLLPRPQRAGRPSWQSLISSFLSLRKQYRPYFPPEASGPREGEGFS